MASVLGWGEGADKGAMEEMSCTSSCWLLIVRPSPADDYVVDLEWRYLVDLI